MNKLLNASKMFVKKNGSTILTCVGSAGVVATSVMAVKATPKAMMLLDDARKEKGDDLTKFEKVMVAGPAYIPAVVVGVSTIACIFGANILNQRQQAALMSAYALLDSSYKEYKSKVVDLYGEEADSRVREEIAKDKYTGDDKPTDNDNVLFYDEFSGRYFESTTTKVLKAEYEINKKISGWGGAYLNDFYHALGLDPTEYGDHLGWSASGLYEMYWEQWLDFNHEKFMLDDGLEGYIITFAQEPIPGFEDY
jgi:hypothetical protein